MFAKEKEYRLVLAGGNRGGDETLDSLKQRVGNLPVEIMPNPDFIKLKDLYSRARFFWHAAGYGIDEMREPEKVEHFGMTTVEAMSAGCVPIVISKGGQKEIITPDSGFLVDTPGEISKTTLSLIQKKNFDKYSKNAIERSEVYSINNFSKNIEKIIS